MINSQHQALKDSELTEGLSAIDAQEVIADFGGQTVSGFRKLIAERDSMDLMFSYSTISAKGLCYFFPAIEDYARSTDSELDSSLPGSFADAIGNQLRIKPAAVYAIQSQVKLLSQYLIDHLGKFDQGDEWEHDTVIKLTGVLDALRQNKTAESDPHD